MKIEELTKLIEGKVVTKGDSSIYDVTKAFTSDLMSDVLTLDDTDSLILVTGLANLQTIRTVEMSNINMVILVRGKKATQEMIDLAEENDTILIETNHSAFYTSALMFNAGIKPLY